MNVAISVCQLLCDQTSGTARDECGGKWYQHDSIAVRGERKED